MTSPRLRFHENPAFRDYCRLLWRLHELITAGRGDSDEADDLAVAMEQPARGLDEAELARAAALSEDLYAVLGDGDTLGATSSPASPGEPGLVREAWDHRDWDRALALLRAAEGVNSGHRAFLRGRAWSELGHHDIALGFIELALRHAPGNDAYLRADVEELVHLGRLDEAMARASGGSSPLLVLKDAEILARVARTASPDHRQRLLRSAAARGLEALEQLMDARSEVRAPALAEVAIWHAELGELEPARRLLREALALAPDHPVLLTAVGVLLFGTEREAAMPVLARARKLGTSLVWPFVYLAQHALDRRDWPGCERLCREGLARARGDRIAARLLEWSAIARFELEGTSASVEELFAEALSQQPADPSVARNYQRFRETRRGQAPTIGWTLGGVESEAVYSDLGDALHRELVSERAA